MPTRQTKSNELILQKQGKLSELWNNLKHSVFDVLFVVLDKTTSEGEEVTIMGLVYESGIDYIQMMQFTFNFTIIMVWNGGQTLNSIFKFLTNVLQVNNLMPSLNYNAFLACLYLLIFCIILVIIDIVYVSYSFSKKKFRFTLPLVLLAQIVPLFVTFLFIPIMEFLLNIINCNPSPSDPNIQVLQYFPKVVCFEGAHIIHVTITLFFTSIFVFISTIVAMTLFEPRMTASTIAARRSSNGEIIFILNKVICQFFFSFTPFNSTWIYIVLMFFPALWLFYFYHFHQPYYNKKVGKLYRIFSAYYFWTVFMLSFSQLMLLLNFNFQGAMVIWFCGLPFIGLNIAYENKSNIDSLFSSNLKFKTGEDLQAHLQYVLLLIHERKKDENSNMLLVGYIQKHIQTCVEEDCPIKVKRPKKEEILSEMDENCNLLIKQLERMYKQGIKKFPDSTKLHISLAFFYMQRLKQNARAYEEFIMAERASPSFIEQFIIYRFKKIIKEKLEENKEVESDLIEIIRFDNHVSLCEGAMLQSAKLHKQFWTELIEETPNLQKLNDTGSKIISIVNTVRYNYTEVNKINSYSPEIIHNYGVYCMFISQNISQGKKCLSQSKRAYYEKKSKGDILGSGQGIMGSGDSSASIVVSATKDSMGKILTVNDNFIEISGYLKEEITEKSIDKLLPQIMLFHHQTTMMQWLSDTNRTYISAPSNQYLHQVHKGFIKQKNGFIVPVHYKVNYSIYEEKFTVNFKGDKEFNQNFEFKIYIITDTRGVIKEISSLGFAYFGFSKDHLAANQRLIDQFGINFAQETLNDKGQVISICKRPTKKQQTNKDFQGKQDQESLQLKEGLIRDDFFVQASKIWMPMQPGDEINDVNMEVRSKNNKKQIGCIFYLQKISKDKKKINEVKMESLNLLGREILDFYEIGQDNNFEDGQSEQPEAQEETPMLSESRLSQKSQLKQAISQLKQAEQQQHKQKLFINYGERIKTYRLVGKDLKRITEQYGQDNSQYDQVDEEHNLMNSFEMDKLKNPVFVQKINQAINTNIDHQQVTILKVTFTVFLICLFVITIFDYVEVNSQLSSLSSYSDINMQWVDDSFYIFNLIHLSFNVTQSENVTYAYQANSNYSQFYTINFNPDILVDFKNGNGQISIVRLNQAMVWMQGDFINFFNPSTALVVDLQLFFYNYYSSVYPALQKFTLQHNIDYGTIIGCLCGIIVLGLVAAALWIYNVMKIQKKCFDVIVWFLDIPIAYVTYLQINCNTFLKSYVQVKELIERGINFHDKNLYLDDYKATESKEQEEQFKEENKSRKIMIARYKNKNIFSQCDFIYIHMLWLLLYAAIMAVLFLVALTTADNFFVFINSQWAITTKQFIWSNNIPNNLRLCMQQNVTYIGNTSLLGFQTTLQNHFLNPVSTLNLARIYHQLITYGTEISSFYHTIYEADICEFEQYDDAQANICKSYLDSKLEGGISSVFTYYSDLQRNRYLQIQHAQFDYINGLMLQLFQLWKSTLDVTIATISNNLRLGIALYLILSVVGFILLWVVYIKRLNVRLNQTIQMLNMIPIRMLPKNRKDIRDFFSWIIKEANRRKSDITKLKSQQLYKKQLYLSKNSF